MFHKNNNNIFDNYNFENENDEANFDFKLELDKILKKDQINKDICLISKEYLTDNFVKLGCGHSFNYIPLFLEIFSQKFSTNNFKTKKNYNTFKCPYCRNYVDHILPDYEKNDLLFSKIYGINTLDKKYILLNTINGKNYYKESYHLEPGKCCLSIEDKDSKIPCRNEVKLFLADGNFYCQKHFSFMNYKYYGCNDSVGPIILKLIDEKNVIKIPKITKKNPKNFIKKEIDESLLCKAILKSGIKKGKSCFCKKKIGDYCLRHSKKNNTTSLLI